VPITGNVTLLGQRPLRFSAVNLSEGGVFVTGGQLFRPGTELSLEVALPELPTRITSRARVVWTNVLGEEDHVASLPEGMGLEFATLEVEAQALLQDFLRSRVRMADDPADLLVPGTVVGSYRILGLVGSGGMSDVYAAEHLSLGRCVALKKLRRRAGTDPNASARFLAEGRIINRVRHPNVLEVTDAFSHGCHRFFVMELLSGMTLADVIDREGRLGITRVAQIGRQVALALAAVHRAEIVHRDLKPANIFLTAHDTVKLLDFGVAHCLEDQSRTRTDVVMGTPAFMSPEQCLGDPVEPRTDLYALGGVLYHALVGHPPFDADRPGDVMMMHVSHKPKSPASLGVLLPVELESLILTCLAKKPADRPASAATVATCLGQLCASPETWTLYNPMAPEPERPDVAAPTASARLLACERHESTKRRRVRLGFGTAGVALVGTLIGWALTPSSPSTGAVEDESLEISPTTNTAMTAPTSELRAAPQAQPILSASTEAGQQPRNLSETRAKALLDEAGRKVKSRELESAIGLCRSVLAEYPREPRAYRTLGIAYALLGSTQRACDNYRRYLRYLPNAADRAQLDEILRRCPAPNQTTGK